MLRGKGCLAAVLSRAPAKLFVLLGCDEAEWQVVTRAVQIGGFDPEADSRWCCFEVMGRDFD